jgi:hypothetical protein
MPGQLKSRSSPQSSKPPRSDNFYSSSQGV